MAVVLFYLCVDTNIADIDSALAIWIERTVSLSCWMIIHVLSEWDGRHKLSGELFPPFHHDYRSLTLSGTPKCAALVYPECGFTHPLLMKIYIYVLHGFGCTRHCLQSVTIKDVRFFFQSSSKFLVYFLFFGILTMSLCVCHLILHCQRQKN